MIEPPAQRGLLTVHRAGGGALFGWPGASARAREAPWRVLAAGPFAAGVIRRLRALGPVDHAIAHWIVPSAWPLLLTGLPKTASHAGHVTDGPATIEVRAHGADVRLLLASPRASRDAVVGALLTRGARFVFAARTLLDALAAALSPPLARDLAAAARVEPPAIDIPDVAERARALRRGLDLAPAERLAVVACRLLPSKRVELAIAAARAAASPIRLVVVGDGPARPTLERLAGEPGDATAAPPPHIAITFTGALPRREALAWIAAADVLLHPSSVEAAPTAIREARALGVPVVACDAGDVAAWARNDPAIAVADATGEALAAAIGAVPVRS